MQQNFKNVVFNIRRLKRRLKIDPEKTKGKNAGVLE